MGFTYLTLEQALDIHHKTIDVSGGGATGLIDAGPLESVLQHIQNDVYYPDFIDKTTHLFFCANRFHCFQDGNKRIAISLSAQFLLMNGYLYCVSRFFAEMENVSYHVAAGRVDKDLLRDIIEAVIMETIDIDEELKLRLLEAMQTE